jgi:predicted hydrocarbon binding protein
MNTWLKELLKNMDENLDESTKIKIMEACGEKCPFTHLPDEKLLKIKNESSNSLDFIDRLSKEWRVKTEGKNIYVIFDKCYCPLVNEDISDASKTLCYCTLGNIKKKFRLGLGKDVKVLMEKTILAGDNECRFKILL